MLLKHWGFWGSFSYSVSTFCLSETRFNLNCVLIHHQIAYILIYISIHTTYICIDTHIIYTHPFMVRCLDFLVGELYKNGIIVCGQLHLSFLTLCPVSQSLSKRGIWPSSKFYTTNFTKSSWKKKKKMVLQWVLRIPVIYFILSPFYRQMSSLGGSGHFTSPGASGSQDLALGPPSAPWRRHAAPTPVCQQGLVTVPSFSWDAWWGPCQSSYFHLFALRPERGF